MNKFLLILLVLVGCGRLPDEGKLKRQSASIRISYNGLQFQDMDFQRGRSTRAITSSQDPFPAYHFIAVEPEVEQLMLDNDMTAEVLVPVDIPLWVEYMNWTQEQPEIYYQYGVSDKFIVTHDSPEKVVVNISVDVNSEYPFPEDETVDNETEEETETVDNETTIDNSTVVDETLLAHYAFEGNLNDNSSYGRHLTEVGTITYSGTTFQNNISGQAAWFDGDVYAYTEDINSDLIGLTDNFTISFWILPDLSNANFDQWHSVMSSGDSTTGFRFQIDHDGNEKLRAFGYLSVDIEAEWMHFTYTKNTDGTDNQKIRVYKNAELKTYLYPMQVLWDKLKIGMNRNGGGGWYGYIDDVRIYNKTLTVDEIEELYESYE